MEELAPCSIMSRGREKFSALIVTVPNNNNYYFIPTPHIATDETCVIIIIMMIQINFIKLSSYYGNRYIHGYKVLPTQRCMHRGLKCCYLLVIPVDTQFISGRVLLQL